jgi:ATP-dependent Clp protease adaptor protein ClpS
VVSDIEAALAAGAVAPAVVAWLWRYAVVRRRVHGELYVLALTVGNDARRRKHTVVTPDHLLVTALSIPDVVEVLGEACSADALVTEVETRLAECPTKEGEPGAVPWSAEAGFVVRSALARAWWGQPLSHALLDSLAAFEGSAVQELLARNGVRRGAVAARRTEPPPSPSASAGNPYRQPLGAAPRARVVFWNDPKTTMVIVMEILKQVFCYSETRALYLMLTVHNQGKTTVWLGPRAEGADLVDRATRLAREQGYPLKVTLDG